MAVVRALPGVERLAQLLGKNRNTAGRPDDPAVVEALEEATADPRRHLDGLLDEVHAYVGELLARDLEVAVDALLAAQAGVYRAALRAALRSRGGVP